MPLLRAAMVACATLAAWCKDYNTEHPHSRLGWRTSTECTQTFASQRAMMLRYP